MTDLIGKTIGRYQVTALLGKGGMAEVYRAFDALLDRDVAIKVIRTEKDGDESFLKRFAREARAIAKLQYPHIVRIHDGGEVEGAPYLVMDYLPGGTLKEYIEKVEAAKKQPMSYRDAARLLAPIARALEFAHQHNIVHRDIKPANILLTANGEPMLSDFGVAKLLEGNDATQLTAAGMGIGTPDYMAPEQWKGSTDGRADIYALGVVLYEMVAGVRPYTANTPAGVMLKHLTTPLTPARQHVPGLPPVVDELISRALAKNPEERYQDMGAFAADLEKIAQQDRPVLVFTGRTPELPRKAFNPAVWGAAGAGLLIGGLVILCGFLVLSAILSRNVPGVQTNAESPTPKPIVLGQQPTLDLTRVATNLMSITRTPFTSIPGLPAEIPILSENNGDLMIGTIGEEMTNYSFSTHLSPEEIIAFYEAGMKTSGWEYLFSGDTSSAEFTNQSYTFQKTDQVTCPDGSTTDSGETLMLFISHTPSTPNYFVSLMYSGDDPCAP